MKTSLSSIWTAEHDNGSIVEIKKRAGVALAICKSYLDKNVQEVNAKRCDEC